jgi:beta-lactamase regulating signal transducer with metallopeptidase domain
MNSFTGIFINIVARTTVLLGLFWIASMLLKQRSAATRYLLRSFGLAAALLMPALSYFVPAWHVPGIPRLAGANSLTDSTMTPADARPVASSSTSVEAQPEHAIAPKTLAKPSAGHSAVSSSAHEQQNFSPIPRSRQAEPLPRPAVNDAHVVPTGSQNEKMNWPFLAGLVWLAGSLLLLTRFVLGRMRLNGIVGKARRIEDSLWLAQVEDIASGMGIRSRILLLQSDEIDVPLTTGALHPKVILSPDYAEWLPLRRAAIIRHELAHIKRLDSITLLLAQITTAIYWFNPLVWLTTQAMRAERERACDDYVLAAGTKASQYAHELLEIATSLRQPELTAALAMARRSQLEGRVLAVLNPAVRRNSVSRRLILGVAALTLGVVLPLAAIQSTAPSPQNSNGQAATPVSPAQPGAPATPGVSSASEPQEPRKAPAAPDNPAIPPNPQAEAPEAITGSGTPAAVAPEAPVPPGLPATPGVAPPPPPPSIARLGERAAAPSTQEGSVSHPNFDGCIANHNHQNMNIEDNNGKKSWIGLWSGDNCSIDLKAEGDIRLNADVSDLESISSGGFFEVSERRGSELRQMRVTPSNGSLQYVYKLNGTQQPVDVNTKTWFGHFLLTLERSTGFSADSRVPRLLKQGGPGAVLDEINNLQGDYVRGIYFRKLLDQPNLPGPIIMRIITQAGQQIKSDYEMARVLMEVSDQYQLADEPSRTAFLNAANHLKSDYEHSRVLLALLKRPNISGENVKMALDSAANIQSDYEKSRILVTLAEFKRFDDNDVATYLKLVPDIHSDYEKSRSLIALMKSHGLNGASAGKILDAASSISSDYEKSRILTTLAEMNTFTESQMDSYLKLVDAIHSDYEKSRSLLTLLERDKLSNSSAGRVLDAVTRITSDYEKSQVLLMVAQKYPMDGALREKYISTANTIHGDYERKTALAAVQKSASI